MANVVALTLSSKMHSSDGTVLNGRALSGSAALRVGAKLDPSLAQKWEIKSVMAYAVGCHREFEKEDIV